MPCGHAAQVGGARGTPHRSCSQTLPTGDRAWPRSSTLSCHALSSGLLEHRHTHVHTHDLTLQVPGALMVRQDGKVQRPAVRLHPYGQRLNEPHSDSGSDLCWHCKGQWVEALGEPRSGPSLYWRCAVQDRLAGLLLPSIPCSAWEMTSRPWALPASRGWDWSTACPGSATQCHCLYCHLPASQIKINWQAGSKLRTVFCSPLP